MQRKMQLTRRSFLSLAGLGVAAVGLAACGGAAASSSPAPAASAPGSTPASSAAASSPAASAPASGSAAASAPASGSPVASASTAASTAPASAAASAGATDIVVAQTSLTPNLDPHSINGQTPVVAQRASFDSLTWFDRDGKVVPWLATAYKEVDPKSWEFTLRTDVTFPDGQPFNANVVKFNIDRLIAAKSGGTANFLGSISGATVVSPTVVRINTNEPDPIMPRRVAAMQMVSTDYPPKIGDGAYGRSKTNGTGPYQATGFVPNSYVTLGFNEKSWRAKTATGSLRNIKLVILSEGAAMLAALKTGDVDIAINPPLDGVGPLKQAGFKILPQPGGGVYIVTMNLRTEPQNSPLRNQDVRLALNYAIDKPALEKAAYGGFGGDPVGQPVGANAFGFNPQVSAYPFDLAKAKQLMAGAGFGSGFTTQLGFPPYAKPFVDPLIGMLGELGVKLDSQAQDIASYAQRSTAGALSPLEVQVSAYDSFFDADVIVRLYTDKVQRYWGGDKVLNDTYAASAIEMDPAKREALLHSIMTRMHDTAVNIYLFNQQLVYATSAKIEGFNPRSDAAVFFDTIVKQK